LDLPLSLISDLEMIPSDRPVTSSWPLGPHPIIDPSYPYVALLTEEGVQMAESWAPLGAAFHRRRLLSAPVTRCLDTVRAIVRGAGWAVIRCLMSASATLYRARLGPAHRAKSTAGLPELPDAPWPSSLTTVLLLPGWT